MKYFFTLLLCCSALFLGCATVVKYAPFDSEQRPPTKSVDVYMTRESVEGEFKEIGLITADDDGWDKSETDLIEEVKKKALSIGADGIILQRSEQKSAGTIPVGGIFYDVVNRIVRALAIVYK